MNIAYITFLLITGNMVNFNICPAYCTSVVETKFDVPKKKLKLYGSLFIKRITDFIIVEDKSVVIFLFYVFDRIFY